jgi:hypothetical protein
MQFAHFVVTTGRIDLTWRAVATCRDLWPEVTIIDNCPGKEISAERWPIPILRPSQPLSVAQNMNWLQELAVAAGLDAYGYQHFDAEPAPGACAELKRLALEACEAKRPWWAMYSNYDVLSAYRTAAVAQLGAWDTRYPDPNYWVDLDMRYRGRLAGLEEVQTGLRVDHLEGGSRSIATPEARRLHDLRDPMNRAYYRAKWGGLEREETFTEPWGGPP